MTYRRVCALFPEVSEHVGCVGVCELGLGFAHNSPAALEDLGAAQAMATVLWMGTGRLLSCCSCLLCMIILSLVVLNTFNQNEHVLLCSVNNANAMQTFHCLLLGISA